MSVLYKINLYTGHYSCYGITKVLHKSRGDRNRDQEIKNSTAYLFILLIKKNTIHEITIHLYVRILEHRGYLQAAENLNHKARHKLKTLFWVAVKVSRLYIAEFVSIHCARMMLRLSW